MSHGDTRVLRLFYSYELQLLFEPKWRLVLWNIKLDIYDIPCYETDPDVVRSNISLTQFQLPRNSLICKTGTAFDFYLLSVTNLCDFWILRTKLRHSKQSRLMCPSALFINETIRVFQTELGFVSRCREY